MHSLLFSATLLWGAATSYALSTSESPILSGSTTTSLNQFATCFTSSQTGRGQPWFFVPDDMGGRFSNEGAKGVNAFYQIRFEEGSDSNRVIARMSQASQPEMRALTDDIKRCW